MSNGLLHVGAKSEFRIVGDVLQLLDLIDFPSDDGIDTFISSSREIISSFSLKTGPDASIFNFLIANLSLDVFGQTLGIGVSDTLSVCLIHKDFLIGLTGLV